MVRNGHARTISYAVLAFLAVAGPSGCSGKRSEGIRERVVTGGPTVVWDITAQPLPQVPLPNDFATRLDPTSPSGRRLNVSTRAVTRYESRLRAKFDQLDGFGTYMPVTVSFDKPIDLRDLWARHNGGPWPRGGEYRDDFRDDAVFLLNVDRRCKRFGEEIALDVGRGRFPVVVDARARRTPDPEAPGGSRLHEGDNVAFESDPRAEANNLLFEEIDEDADGDGVLGPGEDTDFDGHLDKPNFMDPSACRGLDRQSVEYDRCVADQLLTFYDREDNTLILRPVWPMEQRCTHAVVITHRLRGEDGRPVQSPFPSVNPREQTRDLEPVAELLPRYGLSADDVAFAWTFTTGTMTADLEALRKGLHGAGPFARLATEFPVESLALIPPTDDIAQGGVLEPAGCAALSLSVVWRDVIDEWDPNMCAIVSDLAAVDGLVYGTFEAPDLMRDQDGIATAAYPADNDESWVIDAERGTAHYGRTRVTFWCALPKELDTSCAPGNPEGKPFCKPFPTILYAHGYTGSRAGIQDFLGRKAAMGYAGCALDAYGHGMNAALAGLDAAVMRGVFDDLHTPGMVEMVALGRDRDLNNDGIPDSGGDFWTADLFHTRDAVRQSVLEWMQFVRILRSFDGARKTPDGRVMGDLDGDGAVDLAGPKSTVSMWGISLGGILSGVIAGVEPGLDAVSPNAGGGGLSDIATRSRQQGVPEAVLLPMFGPFLAGATKTDEHQNPLPGEKTRLYFITNDAGQRKDVPIGSLEGLEPGERVELANLDKGETAWAMVSPRGSFRVSVPADALDPIERRSMLGLVDGDKAPVEFADTPRLGDRLVLRVFGANGVVKRVVDTFELNTTFQGTTYPAGAPLVAMQEGLGYRRNSPRFRRFLGIAQAALDPADPAVWSAHYYAEPLDFRYDARYDPSWDAGRTRVLVMPTAGDMNVPVNTAIAQARTAGLYGSWKRDPGLPPERGWRELFLPDPRYGHSIDQELIDRYVVEAVERLRRFESSHPELLHQEVLFDIENLSDGTAAWSCAKGVRGPEGDWDDFQCPAGMQGTPTFFTVPAAAPGKELRANHDHGDGTWDAVRIPMLRPQGQHGIYNAQSFRRFDADTYMVNFTLRFLGSRGRDVRHAQGCDCSASTIPQYRLDGTEFFAGLGDRACTADDMKVCTPSCSEAWGLETPPAPVACP